MATFVLYIECNWRQQDIDPRRFGEISSFVWIFTLGFNGRINIETNSKICYMEKVTKSQYFQDISICKKLANLNMEKVTKFKTCFVILI